MRPFPVMMFAAGFGTRMGALTQDQPKPMIHVAGRPLIDHAIDVVQQAGCGGIVVNLHYKPDPLVAHLTPRGITTILEDPDILDTGGGLRNALPLLGSDPVMTSNTDAIWRGPNPAAMLIEQWDPDTMDALMITIPNEQVIGHAGTGDFSMADDGVLKRGPGVVYGGLQIIKTDGLADIPDAAFSLNVLWDRMLAQGRLFGVRYPGMWCDVGHPGGITLAENLLAGTHV